MSEEKNKADKLRELLVEPAPHRSDSATTRGLMIDVIIALLPALAAAIIFFRFNAIRLTGLCLVSCLATEYIFNLIRKKPNSLSDCSAIVTAMILAFSLPPELPWFGVVLGSVVAIGIGKMLFGGLGYNIFNPAMVGRAFLMAAFPVLMTTWIAPSAMNFETTAAMAETVDAKTEATPLSRLKPGDPGRKLPDMKMLFVGRTGGSLGETSVLALLIGAGYLLIRGTIDIAIPFGMLGSAVAFSGIAYLLAPGKFVNPAFHLGSGALIFGAFFIATDLVTTPLSKSGRWIFGAGCGVFTMVIRQFGTYPEGVMFSVLIMNGLAPLITRWTKPKPIGGSANG